MTKVPTGPSKPIQQAFAVWVTAVQAVLQDIERIAKGGQSTPEVTGELMAAVEVARQRCEEADPCDAPLDLPPT